MADDVMSPCRRTGEIARDLWYLADRWRLVLECRIPGTAKAWTQTASGRRVSTAQLPALDAGGHGAPTPAPVSVSVLDVLADYHGVATVVYPRVMRAAGLSTRPVRSRDPRPYLVEAATHLTVAADRDDSVPIAVASAIRPLTMDVARLMGDVRDGQLLAGICPWCRGRTAAGTGVPTMRLHYPPADAAGPIDPDGMLGRGGDQPLIVCHGLNCAPPSAACGESSRGRPAWTPREWDWLAKMLLPLDETTKES